MHLAIRLVSLALIATVALIAGLSCTEETIVNNPVTDQRPPLVEWVSVGSTGVPAGQQGFPSVVRDTVTLTLSVTDDSGIDSVKVYINGFPRYTATPPTPPSIEGGDFEFLWPTLSDSDGVYSLEARAWDKAGNAGGTPTLLLRVSNTTPPLRLRIEPRPSYAGTRLKPEPLSATPSKSVSSLKTPQP